MIDQRSASERPLTGYGRHSFVTIKCPNGFVLDMRSNCEKDYCRQSTTKWGVR